MFECELSKPVKKVSWLRNGKAVTPDSRVKVTSDGTKHSLTFTQAKVEDSAKYSVKVGDLESTAKLSVEGGWLSSSVFLVKCSSACRVYA